VTNGHLDVVRRATDLFDEVVVAVLSNPAKQSTFTLTERLDALGEALAELPAGHRRRVHVRPAEGLLVDFAAAVGAVAVVKGLRSGTDFAYELPMALMNRHLSGLETVFLPADPSLEHISSSLVKEVVALGGDARGLVPDAVLTRLLARLRPAQDQGTDP
jgi:pantetheine-phosphate adenylyltransferase